MRDGNEAELSGVEESLENWPDFEDDDGAVGPRGDEDE